MGQGTDTTNKNKRILAVIKLLILLVIVAGVPLYLYLRFGDELFSKDIVYRLEAYLKLHRSGAALTLAVLQIVQVIIYFLPGQPIQFASSYMFGIIRGFLISIIGAVVGTFISFFTARFLGRDFVELLFDKDKVDDYDSKLNSGKGLLLVLLIYLLPGVPKDLLSYVAGISGMRFRPFILISTIGRSPGMLGSLLLGHFFNERNYKAIAIIAVLAAFILIICFIYRKEILRILDDIEAREARRLGSELPEQTEQAE